MYCPPTETLHQFVNNELSKDQRIQLLTHLSICKSCQRNFEFLHDLKYQLQNTSMETENDKAFSCLTEDEIIDFVDATALTAEMSPMLTHLINCEDCLHKVVTLHSALDSEGTTPIEIPSRILKRVQSFARISEKIDNPASLKYFWQKFFTRQVSAGTIIWRTGLALSLLFILFFLMLASLSALQITRKNSGPIHGIVLKSPTAVIHTDLPVFKWEGIVGIKEYLIKVKNLESGKVIWEARTSGTQIGYPRNARTTLKNDLHYSWDVTAFESSGNQIGSDIIKFSIAAATH